MDPRGLLLDLEAYYQGLGTEYLKDRDHARGVDVGDDDEGDVVQEPHLRLRSTETVPALFGYQRELVEAFEQACFSPREENIALLALPTGAGKTRTAAVALLKILTSGRASLVLWLAPTRELLEQAAATLETAWHSYRSAVDLDVVRADLLGRFPVDLERAVLFATPQMIAARLKKGTVPKADIVVFDEAHHVEAPMFRRALGRVRQERNAAVIGLSATPGRTRDDETERLVDFFDGRLLTSEQLGRDPIAVLQRRGVLARIVFKDVPWEGEGCHRTAGRSVSSAICLFRAVVRLACALARKSRVLVFAESVEHARLLAAALRCQGIRAAAVSSRDQDEVRRGRLRAFERGELSVIVNKRLLATGYDCPAVRHVILATRIGSPILFEQIVGRASRGPLVGGHARSTVWQIEDHLAVHGLPQSYYRYSDYDWKHLSDSRVKTTANRLKTKKSLLEARPG